MNTFITILKDIPTHIWMALSCIVLLTAYYIRPDPVTVDLLKSFAGALLLSLRTGTDQRPPATNQKP